MGQRSNDTKSELAQSEARGEEMSSESPEHSREILDESVDHDSDRERQSVEGKHLILEQNFSSITEKVIHHQHKT